MNYENIHEVKTIIYAPTASGQVCPGHIPASTNIKNEVYKILKEK